MVEEIVKNIAIYSGAVVTTLSAIVLVLKTSNTASKWLSTKIVQNADLSNTKINIHSCMFENDLRNISAKLKDIDNVRMILKRLEYLNVRQHNSDDEMLINAIYDDYKKLGGNSYIDLDYERWTKERNSINKTSRKTK